MSGFDVHDIITKPVSERSAHRFGIPGGHSEVRRRPILVVDDDPSVLKLAEATLSAAGYRCVVGAMAAPRCKPRRTKHPRPWCWTSTCRGWMASRSSKSSAGDPLSHRIPVLVWTELDLPAEKRARLLAKAQGLISKSAGPTPLIERLRFYVPPPREV